MLLEKLDNIFKESGRESTYGKLAKEASAEGHETCKVLLTRADTEILAC